MTWHSNLAECWLAGQLRQFTLRHVPDTALLGHVLLNFTYFHQVVLVSVSQLHRLFMCAPYRTLGTRQGPNSTAALPGASLQGVGQRCESRPQFAQG